MGKELIDAAKPYIGNSQIVDFQVHGWRYSKPISVDVRVCDSQSSQLPPIAVAGDAFAGPRFEGAVVSGWSAAKTLEAALNSSITGKLSIKAFPQKVFSQKAFSQKLSQKLSQITCNYRTLSKSTRLVR